MPAREARGDNRGDGPRAPPRVLPEQSQEARAQSGVTPPPMPSVWDGQTNRRTESHSWGPAVGLGETLALHLASPCMTLTPLRSEPARRNPEHRGVGSRQTSLLGPPVRSLWGRHPPTPSTHRRSSSPVGPSAPGHSLPHQTGHWAAHLLGLCQGSRAAWRHLLCPLSSASSTSHGPREPEESPSTAWGPNALSDPRRGTSSPVLL